MMKEISKEENTMFRQLRSSKLADLKFNSNGTINYAEHSGHNMYNLGYIDICCDMLNESYIFFVPYDSCT
jgi:hypothetical protein